MILMSGVISLEPEDVDNIQIMTRNSEFNASAISVSEFKKLVQETRNDMKNIDRSEQVAKFFYEIFLEKLIEDANFLGIYDETND